jgi:hypothetical protein
MRGLWEISIEKMTTVYAFSLGSVCGGALKCDPCARFRFSWRFWHWQDAQRERKAIKDRPDAQDHRGSLARQARWALLDRSDRRDRPERREVQEPEVLSGFKAPKAIQAR